MLRYPLFIFLFFLLSHFLNPFTFSPFLPPIRPSFPFHLFPITFSPPRYSHCYHGGPSPDETRYVLFKKRVISLQGATGRENFPQPYFLFLLQILRFRAQVQDNYCPPLRTHAPRMQ
jgi:hypothetical protein